MPPAPQDAPTGEYLKYLEKSGVVDALTSILVGMLNLKEWPQDPTEYLRRYLGDTTKSDLVAYKADNERLEKKRDLLRRKLEDLVRANVELDPPGGHRQGY